MPIPSRQLEALRRRLEDRRDELNEDRGNAIAESRRRADVRSQVHDDVDEAVADDRSENALTEAERTTDALAAVERALGRMAAGSYGLCTVCGSPIELERLRADPAAERCIDDQRRRERDLAAESPSL